MKQGFGNETGSSGWYFGLENLTAHVSGVVFWRGIEVGFVDPDENEREAKQKAAAIVERCLKAEARGIPVCSKTICERSPLASAPVDSPWEEAMMHHLTVFETDEKAVWLVLDVGIENSGAVAVAAGENGEAVMDFAVERGGAHTIYMRMMKNGLRSNVRRLEKYDDFVETMKEAGITTGMVSEAIRAGQARAGEG